MDINQTIEILKALQSLGSAKAEPVRPTWTLGNEADLTPTQTTNESPFLVGKAYLIRTVTMTWTGRVTAIKGGFLCLEDAAWIADTGRFNVAISKGELEEVEPVGNSIVSLASIVDACEWKFNLPKDVK